MKPHESLPPPPPPIEKKSIRGDSGDSWPVWNRGVRDPNLTKDKVKEVYLQIRRWPVFYDALPFCKL